MTLVNLTMKRLWKQRITHSLDIFFILNCWLTSIKQNSFELLPIFEQTNGKIVCLEQYRLQEVEPNAI
jgi:hypothetical protein